MIKPAFRISLIIFLLFLLDLIKPFGYSLSVEFIFLGLIAIALSQPLLIVLFSSLLAAYLRDFFIFSGFSISLLEFPFLGLIIYQIRSYRFFLNRQKHFFIAKALIVASSLLTHILLNSLASGLIVPFFSLQFFVQSLSIYYLIDYLWGLKAGHNYSF